MLRGVEMMKTIYLTTIEEGYLGADNLLDAEVFCEMVNTIYMAITEEGIWVRTIFWMLRCVEMMVNTTYLATTEEGFLGADNLLDGEVC